MVHHAVEGYPVTLNKLNFHLWPLPPLNLFEDLIELGLAERCDLDG